MIAPTKKRLAIVFTSVIVVFNAMILVLSYIGLHQSLVSGVERHMTEDIQGEFVEQYRRFGLSPLKEMWDENHLQILSRKGRVIVSAPNSAGFAIGLNKRLLAAAFAGKQGFETRMVGGDLHLVSYFPLDGNYAGRAAISLDNEVRQEENFLRLIFIFSPVMLLLSYLVSRYLLNHAMKPISELCTFQETFSSNVTHELRSPLAAIKGTFEVALRKERPAAEYREAIRSGLAETDRIISLLNNLSLLASSRFRPLDLSRNTTDLSRILREVVASYAAAMQAKGITPELDVSSGLTCTCDEALIRRTMENLVDNAVKYTTVGGKIRLSLTKERGKIVFASANTCEPLEEEELKQLFEPFFRGRKSSLQSKGKGLGLYLVNYIVKSHGGTVTAGMTGDGLFSVTVTLPE
jgi:signal transduction histidine kinase